MGIPSPGDVEEGGASGTACPAGLADGACGTRRGLPDIGGSDGHSCGCRWVGFEATAWSSTSSPCAPQEPKRSGRATKGEWRDRHGAEPDQSTNCEPGGRRRRRGDLRLCLWQPSGCVSCEPVCVCVSLVRIVIICLASNHTALVSSPSLTVLHLPTYIHTYSVWHREGRTQSGETTSQLVCLAPLVGCSLYVLSSDSSARDCLSTLSCYRFVFCFRVVWYCLRYCSRVLCGTGCTPLVVPPPRVSFCLCYILCFLWAFSSWPGYA